MVFPSCRLDKTETFRPGMSGVVRQQLLPVRGGGVLPHSQHYKHSGKKHQVSRHNRIICKMYLYILFKIAIADWKAETEKDTNSTMFTKEYFINDK